MWALLLGAVISIGRFRAVQKHNEGLDYSDSDYKRNDEAVPMILLGFVFLFSLIFYYLMCKDTGTRQFVANIDRELNVQQYVQQLRRTIPAVRFDATCYHNETRTRSVPVTTTDARGNSSTTYT